MNMKQKAIILTVAFFAAVCESYATEKPTYERGWIGGEYKLAKRALVLHGWRSAVYVKQVFPETPAAHSGLQPGDLILSLDGRAVTELRGFRRLVDTAKPGSRTTITVWRENQSLDLPLTVGRETYHQWHAFTIGVHASSKFDLWPNPDFSLLPLARFNRPQGRIELRSPEMTLARQRAGKSSQGETGVRSAEGWDAWFVLFGFDAHKRILSQEVVAPITAMR
jgi:hypothetical protein